MREWSSETEAGVEGNAERLAEQKRGIGHYIFHAAILSNRQDPVHFLRQTAGSFYPRK